MTDKPPVILGVAEMVINVRDLPVMREFYREVLGFPVFSEASHRHGPEPDVVGDPTICFLTIQATQTPLGLSGLHPQLLVLIDFEQHVFARSRFDGHDVRRSTLNHLAFEIAASDLEEQFDRLEQLGLQPTKSVFATMSAEAIFFRDPEGNTLELIAHRSSNDQGGL